MSVKSTRTPDDSTVAPDVTKLSGFVGDTTKFLDGTGVFSTPSGSGTSGITQLTGDVLAGPGSGSVVATLSTTGVTAGTYGSSTEIPIISVNAKGQVTTAATTSFTGGSGITELTGDVTAGPGSGSVASTLSTTGVVAGSYIGASVTVDSKGRITSAANGVITTTGTAIYAMSTTDTTVVSSTVVVNDPALVIAIPATTATYIMEIWTQWTTGASNTPDCKARFTFPAGTTLQWNWAGLSTSAASAADVLWGYLPAEASPTTSLSRGIVGSDGTVIWGKGTLTVGATTGNLQFQFAQNASSTIALTRKAGSWMSLTRVL